MYEYVRPISCWQLLVATGRTKNGEIQLLLLAARNWNHVVCRQPPTRAVWQQGINFIKHTAQQMMRCFTYKSGVNFFDHFIRATEIPSYFFHVNHSRS
jgi:hypothetical protein